MSKFELIIFDCDGVIVDSEKIANVVFAEVLEQECGLSMDLDEMFNTFVGHSSSECFIQLTCTAVSISHDTIT